MWRYSIAAEVNNCRMNTGQTLKLQLLTYLESLLSSCSVLRSLLSVLSGRPLAASELARDTFGRFSGRGVPGPFTFLIKSQQRKEKRKMHFYNNEKKTLLYFMWISNKGHHLSLTQPLCKSRCVSRKHHSIHSIDSTASIFPVQASKKKYPPNPMGNWTFKTSHYVFSIQLY